MIKTLSQLGLKDKTVTPGTVDVPIPPNFIDSKITVLGDADLISSNVKAGANIFGVTGDSNVVDTTDATAIASKILLGETAYVVGIKVTGSMVNRGAVTINPATTDIAIPSGYHNGAGVVKGANIFSLSPGSTVFVPSSAMTTNKYTESLSPVKMKEVRINVGGTVRVSFQLASGDSRETAYGRLYVNGAARGVVQSTTGSVYFTEDIAIAAGDLLQLYAWRAGAYASVAHVWDFYVNISSPLYQVLMDA